MNSGKKTCEDRKTCSNACVDKEKLAASKAEKARIISAEKIVLKK